MFPVRCYTCNDVIAQHYRVYRDLTLSGNTTPRECLDAIGVTRMCCRRMFVSHVESLAENNMRYPNLNTVLDKGGTTLFRRCHLTNTVSCD